MLRYGAGCVTPAHRGQGVGLLQAGPLGRGGRGDDSTERSSGRQPRGLDSPFSADRAGPSIGVKVLLQAPLAEPVPAVGRATRVPQDLRAYRAEPLGSGLRLKHKGSRVWICIVRANDRPARRQRRITSRISRLANNARVSDDD